MMNLIKTTLLLSTLSFIHGDPLPEPNPDPNIIIQVRQEVHRRYCNKPHDEEGPEGHPTTEATVDVEVDVNALQAAAAELENEIAQAQADLDAAAAEVEALEDEVAQEEQDIADLDAIAAAMAALFARRRKRESVYENVKDVLGGLSDIFEERHRSRRSSAYCPAGTTATETGFELLDKAMVDITAAMSAPLDIQLALCLMPFIENLKASLVLTAEEEQAMKDKANAAANQAEATKQAKETAVATKKAELDTKKAEKEALEKEIQEKEDEKAALEESIAANSATTDLPETTIEVTENVDLKKRDIHGDEPFWTEEKVPATTEPTDVLP